VSAPSQRDAQDVDPVKDLTTSTFRIAKPADVLELVATGVHRAIVLADQIDPRFFDLSSGFAGELVQKCLNYGLRIAVVDRLGSERSMHFRQFAGESNRHGRFIVTDSTEDALKRLSAQKH
jgi:hypothetical protein